MRTADGEFCVRLELEFLPFVLQLGARHDMFRGIFFHVLPWQLYLLFLPDF